MRTLRVHRARDRFTAGAPFTQDEHVAPAGRDAPHQGKDFADRRGRAEDAAGGEFDTRRRFRLRRPCRARELPGVGDRGRQIFFADRTGDEIGDAEPQALDDASGLRRSAMQMIGIPAR